MVDESDGREQHPLPGEGSLRTRNVMQGSY